MLKHWLTKAAAELSLWDGLLMIAAASWMLFIWAARQLF
jgi:hypothetical protein